MKKQFLSFVFSLVIVFSSLTIPQSNTFTIEAYKQFLSTHQNMDAGDILQLHNAGKFLGKISAQTQNVLYLDSIAIKYNLTPYEKSLIEQNGFMVTDRLKGKTVSEVMIDIFQKDLPFFISTDIILHSLHLSYDLILKDVELGYLIPKLTEVLDLMHKQIPMLKTLYAQKPEMMQSLQDVDLYLGMAQKLLTGASTYYYPSNTSEESKLLELIKANTLAPYPLFSKTDRYYDFSQFKVRGHYTDEINTELGKYFQAMMWLGRTEFYLTKIGKQTKEDIQRQIIDALLLSELMASSNTQTSLNEIDDIIKFFVGESDNVTFANLTFLKEKLQLTDASELLDTNKVAGFQTELAKYEFASQRILSQVIMATEVDSIVPPSAFLFLGQRFIIDSYVFSQVVYDRINYKGMFIKRMLPQSLDILFALGNNASAQLLQQELETYHYATNLSSLRYLIDAYSDDFWKSSMYNAWLQSIRTLNPPAERSALPQFMQTAAYWQSKMNTQLASWSQLRHDNLLYAKQSYTGGVFCSFPYVYVEPFPEFYQRLNEYAAIAKQKFQSVQFKKQFYRDFILMYFNSLSAISDTLGVIAGKTLRRELLTENEKHFLLTTLSQNTLPLSYGQRLYDGWISRLFYDQELFYNTMMKSENVIADVHTSPTDASGNLVGWVKHVGTGNLNLGVWVTDNFDNKPTAFVGPALSYYEYTSTNFLRLTDEEWQTSYLNTALRPLFVNLYLADSAGNTKGNGPMLLTSIERKDNPVSEKNYLVAQNYPNPFNPSTIISFSLPEAMANQNVSLKIFNITGELVKVFFEKELPAGNYLTRWDGTNEMGTSLPSGVYLYKVTAGNHFVTGKMNLVK